MLKSSLINLHKKNKIELQVRSIFLQGLLLKELKYKNLKFSRYSKIWSALHSWLDKNKYDLIDVCINDSLRHNFDTIIVGFENFASLPTIEVCYLKAEYGEPELKFASINSSTIAIIS